MGGFAASAFVIAALSVGPVFAAGDQSAIDQLPPGVRNSMRSGVFVERFISDRLAPLREADIDRDGLDTADLDRRRQRAAAQARIIRLSTVFANDANGDGRVTRDEIRAVTLSALGGAEVNPKSVEGAIERLMKADRNNDDVITVEETLQPEAVAAPAVDSGLALLESYLAIDPDKNGKLTADELAALARRWFSAVDTNGDGFIDKVEAAAWSKVAQPEQRVRPVANQCGLPKPDRDALVLAFGVYDGSAYSSVAVAGLDEDTASLRVTIEPGPQPIYLVLSALQPTIWQVEGARERLSRVILISGQFSPTGASRTGVTGVAPEKVTFAPMECRGITFYDTDEIRMATARGQLAQAVGGRSDVMLMGKHSVGSVSLPSGTIARETGEQTTPDGFDPDMWQEALRFSPGGLRIIDPKTVVSEEPVASYDVLPQQAGLAQLLGSGALVRLRGTGEFKIVKPIPRYPASLGGAHSVKFLLGKGVTPPQGDPVHSCVVSEETGQPLFPDKPTCR